MLVFQCSEIWYFSLPKREESASVDIRGLVDFHLVDFHLVGPVSMCIGGEEVNVFFALANHLLFKGVASFQFKGEIIWIHPMVFETCPYLQWFQKQWELKKHDGGNPVASIYYSRDGVIVCEVSKSVNVEQHTVTKNQPPEPTVKNSKNLKDYRANLYPWLQEQLVEARNIVVGARTIILQRNDQLLKMQINHHQALAKIAAEKKHHQALAEIAAEKKHHQALAEIAAEKKHQQDLSAEKKHQQDLSAEKEKHRQTLEKALVTEKEKHEQTRQCFNNLVADTRQEFSKNYKIVSAEKKRAETDAADSRKKLAKLNKKTRYFQSNEWEDLKKQNPGVSDTNLLTNAINTSLSVGKMSAEKSEKDAEWLVRIVETEKGFEKMKKGFEGKIRENQQLATKNTWISTKVKGLVEKDLNNAIRISTVQMILKPRTAMVDVGWLDKIPPLVSSFFQMNGKDPENAEITILCRQYGRMLAADFFLKKGFTTSDFWKTPPGEQPPERPQYYQEQKGEPEKDKKKIQFYDILRGLAFNVSILEGGDPSVIELKKSILKNTTTIYPSDTTADQVVIFQNHRDFGDHEKLNDIQNEMNVEGKTITFYFLRRPECLLK